MVVIIVLLVLIIMIASLLFFAGIYNQKRQGNQRKVEYFHGLPVVGFSYPKADKPDSEKSLEELENEMLHLWVDGFLTNCKTQGDVLKFTRELYTSSHSS